MDQPRKIIHIDMDCFYAAIEIRDRPELKDQAVAIGGPETQRGVICTANYIARQYGVHSAMPVVTALRQCKNLVLLPVDMPKYQAAAKKIHAIFREFTDLVEPLALDEAYLEVTNSPHYQGSATRIAQAIQKRIWDAEHLTASAGVAPNKFLAKIASGWKKPNGLFIIHPTEVQNFIRSLPVQKLWGVGKVTAEKLLKLHFHTCEDLQNCSLIELVHTFGKLGQNLYDQCRGIDHRPVEAHRVRKSLSVEETFSEDLSDPSACTQSLENLHLKLLQRLHTSAPELKIKNQYIKIKFYDFKQVTAEVMSNTPDLHRYLNLFQKSWEASKKPIRLLGLGVHFEKPKLNEAPKQPYLIDF